MRSEMIQRHGHRKGRLQEFRRLDADAIADPAACAPLTVLPTIGTSISSTRHTHAMMIASRRASRLGSIDTTNMKPSPTITQPSWR